MNERTALSALFAIKNLLVKWKVYARSSICVDERTQTLSIAESSSKEKWTNVVEAKVDDFKLKLSWLDGAWESWEECQSSF